MRGTSREGMPLGGRDRVLLAWLVVVCAVAPVAGAEAQFTRVRDVLLAPVHVNGVGPYPFVLDLGIREAVVNTDVAAYLHLGTGSEEGEQGEGKEAPSVAVAAVESLRVGEEVLPVATVLVMDLGGFEARLGQRVAGVLPGMLAGKRLTLDFEHEQVAFRDAGRDENRSKPGMRTVPIRFDRGCPEVSGLIDGKHLRPFVVDTTCAATVAMPEDVLRELKLLEADTPRLCLMPGPDGSSAPLGHTQIRLGELRLGGATVAEPVCVVLEAGGKARIGLGFLGHYCVTLGRDGGKGWLRLANAGDKRVSDPAIVGHGLTLASYRGGDWSVCVAAESPAARAGLVSGDLLVAVGGEEAKGRSYAEVMEKLSGAPGQETEVAVLHLGEEKTVALTAERLL